jgi:inhibitor of cysteine peptidase
MRLLPFLAAIWLLAVGCLGESDQAVGIAQVEGIEIEVMESFPVQVAVIASGHYPDSCTETGSITQRRNENLFSITIETIRDPDLLCAQVMEPFQESVSLDVLGLPAGTYLVDVNGVRDSFALANDNMLPSSSVPE